MRKFFKMLLAILMLITGIISVSISASADELTGTPLFGDISLTLSNGTYTGKVTAYNDVAEDIGDIYIAIYNSEDGELEQVSSTPIISSGGTQTFTCTLSPKVTGTYTAKMFIWDNEQKPFSGVTEPETVITYTLIFSAESGYIQGILLDKNSVVITASEKGAIDGNYTWEFTNGNITYTEVFVARNFTNIGVSFDLNGWKAEPGIWTTTLKKDGNVVCTGTFEIPKSTLSVTAISAAPLLIAAPAGYAVNASKKSYNMYDVEIVTAAPVVEHLTGSGIIGKWVGFRVVAPTDASYAKGTFGGTDYGSIHIETDGFIDFYVDANNPKDIATLTFYDSSGNALTAEMIFNIDVSGVVK